MMPKLKVEGTNGTVVWADLPAKIVMTINKDFVKYAEEMVQAINKNLPVPTEVFEVQTEGDIEGKSMKTLGYAVGEKNDIRNHFDKRKIYSIKLNPINIIHVTAATAKQVENLLTHKKQHEDNLNTIKAELKTLGYE